MSFLAAFLLVISCAQVLGADQAEDSSIEIEFWQSVKDSGDQEMLRAYLEEFPDGQFKSLAKIKLKQLTEGENKDAPVAAEWVWCVNPDPEAFSKRPFYTTVEICGNRPQFATQAAAEAEQRRLNDQSSTTPTKSAGKSNQQTQAREVKTEFFDMCEKAFYDKDFRLEHKLYKNWADVVYHGVIKAYPQQPDAADLVEKCRPFLSDDLLSWTASSQIQADALEQAESNASEASMEDLLPKTNWCGDSSGSYEASATECISTDGVPTRTKSDAQWITQNYFGIYEEHKAFAISNGSFGFEAYATNPEVAKQRALLSCNMRAINARTCRVVNIDGRGANFVDFQESSKPVFSARGQQTDLTGRYYLKLRNSDGMDATLRLERASGEIGGSIKVCFEGNHCANYQIKEIFEQNRGRHFRSGLYLKHNPGARWPEGWQLSTSFSSDTSLVIGEVGPYIFDGEKYSQ